MQPRKLFIDVEGRRFIDGADSTLAAGDYVAFNEDVEALELYFLEPTGDVSAPYRYLDYSSNTVKLALGITAPAASVTSWSALSTAVTITASVSITGGSGTTAIQRVQITPSAASGSYVLKLPTRNVTISSVASSIFNAPYHGLADGQSVTLTGFSTPSGFSNGSVYFVRDRSRDGFKIALAAGETAITASVASGGGTAVTTEFSTPPISAQAAPSEIAAALASATGDGAQNITVSGTPDDYLLTYGGVFAGASMPLINSAASTLIGAAGLSANLSLNTVEIANLVTAGTTDVTLEVEVSSGGIRQTFQREATLASDIISSTSPTPTPVGSSGFNMIAGNGDVYTITIDDDGILTATKIP
jgi:hypothetical protein